nr:glycosyltransferase family 39 protein [Bacteroidota bacterium]
MLNKKTLSTPNILIVVSFAIIVVFRFIEAPVKILSWDVFGYYLYLPARFIYHDLTIQNREWLDLLVEKYQPTSTLYQIVAAPNGNFVMKYTLGLSVVYAPFFFVAHLLAEPLGFPADGLSLPYQYSMAIGGLLAVLIGLIVFMRILRFYFDEKISIILFLLIIFGTNYFQLVTFDGTVLSHNYLFTLYAILVCYTIKWHKKPTLKSAIAVGLSAGFIILIRPSEMVCLLIPLLWNIWGRQSIIDKYHQLIKHPSHVFAMVIALVIAGIPQLLYWKAVSGSFLFYSYTNPGEGFEFLWPYTLKFLFGFRKGWFIYTPVMLFAMVGFYHLYKFNRQISIPILLFFVLNLWIISSWSCWWYAGGSFSSRSLIPAYVVLAIPLGYFVNGIRSKKPLKSVLFIIGIFLILLNLFQTWQWMNGIISKDWMTKEYYLAVFGKTEVTEAQKRLLLVDRNTEAEEFFTNEAYYSKRNIYLNGFEDPPIQDSVFHSGSSALP